MSRLSMSFQFPPSPRVKIVTPLPRISQFQPRAQLERVMSWWESGDPSICSLTGRDGAGKTALLDRFLRVLTGKMQTAPRGGERESEFPNPLAVFVFSLDAVPNPDFFFARLWGWLTGETVADSAPRPSALQVVQRLRDLTAGEAERPGTTPLIFLALDGVEKYHGCSKEGGEAAELRSDGLALLVRRVSAGRLPGVRLLLTSGQSNPFPEYTKSEHIEEIAVELLSREESIGLLRKHDIRGLDHELAEVADWCGRETLAVDLAGRYLVAFHEAEASSSPLLELSRRASLRPETEVDSGATPDPLDPLVRGFQSRLHESDPSLWPLLERAGLFRLGVTAEMLSALFVGETKEEISGDALAHLHPLEVPQKLERLKDLGLLEGYSGDRYSVHPALRERVMSGASTEILVKCHDRIRRALETVPGGRPALAEATDNPTVLDLLEEIIHHSLQSSHIREAFNAYWYRMGRFDNLGFGLGDFERGERVCRAILAALPKGGTAEETVYLQAAHPALLNELALYLDGLGRLDEAARLHESAVERELRDGDRTNGATALLNLADIRIQQGRLPDAIGRVEQALALADDLDDSELRRTGFALRGYVRFLLGETESAEEDFQTSRRWQSTMDEEEDSLYSGRGVWLALLLMGMGRWEEARALTERNKAICGHHFGQEEPTTPRCNVILAELAARRGDFGEAEGLLDDAEQWAYRHNSRSMVCRLAEARAFIALLQDEIECGSNQEAAKESEMVDADSEGGGLDSMLSTVEDALLLARECGYGLVEIDLLLRRGEILRARGLEEAARQDIKTALAAASAPECRYAPGEQRARAMLPSE